MDKLRVVIADDESLICMDLQQALHSLGHEVVGEAAQGDVALRLIRELRPDLAILDIRMPKLDGIQVAESVMAEHICAVILLTAYSQVDLAHRAEQAGVLGYLVKPFTESDLLPAIAIACARFEEMEALRQQVGTLEETIETRKLVDRAKGLLMTYQRVSEPAAFRILQTQSMNTRKSLKEVAQSVIKTYERFPRCK